MAQSPFLFWIKKSQKEEKPPTLLPQGLGLPLSVNRVKMSTNTRKRNFPLFVFVLACSVVSGRSKRAPPLIWGKKRKNSQKEEKPAGQSKQNRVPLLGSTTGLFTIFSFKFL